MRFRSSRVTTTEDHLFLDPLSFINLLDLIKHDYNNYYDISPAASVLYQLFSYIPKRL
jgi:hypothetical protein